MHSCDWLSLGTQCFRFILLIAETTPPYELVTHLLLTLELFPVWAAVNKAALTTLLQVVCVCVYKTSMFISPCKDLGMEPLGQRADICLAL